MTRLLPAFAALIALAPQAFADTAGALRARLSQLGGGDPVHASITVDVWSRGSLDDGRAEQGRAAFELRAGPGGVEFHYPPAELARADAEERKYRANPELKTPTMTALREIDALEAHDFLNFAPTLLGYLQRGKIVGERQESFAGRPAKLLAIDVDPPIPQSLRKRIREVRYRVNVWIGPDGVPLAAEASLRGKARFLVVSFEHAQTQKWSFTHRGNRLLVTSHVDTSRGSGLGQKFERRVAMNLNLR